MLKRMRGGAGGERPLRQSSRPRAFWILLGSAGCLLGAILVGKDQIARVFQPPRVAVVDIAQVFELYTKKKDRKDEFDVEVKGLEDKLKSLEARYKQITAEIPSLEEGARKDELETEKFKIEQNVRRLKETEMNRLRELEVKYLQEIRDEIEEEIQGYSKALDLDIVLEKTVNAEMGRGAGIKWPIVHFVKPELEVTAEIAARLNGRYKPAPRPAGAQGTQNR